MAERGATARVNFSHLVSNYNEYDRDNSDTYNYIEEELSTNRFLTTKNDEREISPLTRSSTSSSLCADILVDDEVHYGNDMSVRRYSKEMSVNRYSSKGGKLTESGRYVKNNPLEMTASTEHTSDTDSDTQDAPITLIEIPGVNDDDDCNLDHSNANMSNFAFVSSFSLLSIGGGHYKVANNGSTPHQNNGMATSEDELSYDGDAGHMLQFESDNSIEQGSSDGDSRGFQHKSPFRMISPDSPNSNETVSPEQRHQLYSRMNDTLTSHPRYASRSFSWLKMAKKTVEVLKSLSTGSSFRSKSGLRSNDEQDNLQEHQPLSMGSPMYKGDMTSIQGDETVS